ncbi:hypothetical protein [Streptomyces nigrescens]|nr:hypothetical protein [Streptomyces nigrescens]
MAADKPESSSEEPTQRGTHVVDCKKLADAIEQARAETGRHQQEPFQPTATPIHRGTVTVKAVAVPEECRDEFKARGLR